MQKIVDNLPETTLTAFFELCNSDEFAKTLLYHEVPHYYTWANNKFSRRKRGQDVVEHPGIKKMRHWEECTAFFLPRVFLPQDTTSPCTWPNIVPGLKNR